MIDVGEALRRLHEGQVHRPDGLVVLLPNLREGAAPLLEIPADPAHEPDVGVGVDEELHLEARAETVVGEDQDSLDDDDRGRRDAEPLLGAIVDREIVRRPHDRRARPELIEVAA